MGFTARDLVTGFSGEITGHARYITGCDQFLLQPETNKDGEWVKAIWFDDERLEVDGTKGSAFLAKVEERQTRGLKTDKAPGGPRSDAAPTK